MSPIDAAGVRIAVVAIRAGAAPTTSAELRVNTELIRKAIAGTTLIFS